VQMLMASTPEGHIKSVHEGGATPSTGPDDKVKGDARALPRMRVEQLRARHKELEDA
jgi:hypothetical protein